MRNISRLIAGLCLFGSAACASDGILAPRIQPESEGLATAALAAEPAPGPAAPETPVVTLRCSRSLPANTGEPLYIINGVVQATAPADIDPADIEAIEVIRGATVASLYGSRAANGVIVITTRTSAPRRA